MLSGGWFTEDGVNQETLAEILYMDKGTTARAIRKLEESGLIRRVESDRDKREKIIYLTEEGWALEEPVKKIMKKWDEEIIKNLEEEEILSLRKLLEKISDSHSMK
ncbi:MAG: MarR family winged helix-turn-helix transcriptional regulator [Fusobacteriaceae bacterium]